jgi:hypothetical protein
MGSCSSHDDKVVQSRSVHEIEKILTKQRDLLEDKYKDMPEVEGKSIII